MQAVAFSIAPSLEISGGGISILSINNNASSSILNSTISGNTAGDSGGGIDIIGYSFDSILNLAHVTIAENESTNGGDGLNKNDGGTVNASYSLISNNGDFNISGVLDSDNQNVTDDLGNNLAPLADNGGLTQTHALLPGATNAINQTTDSTIGEDQRGEFRDDQPDIGAFEFDDLPVANEDTFSVVEDSSANELAVTGNDTFGLNGAASGEIIITTVPSNGSATVDNNGTLNDPTDDGIVYTPNPDFDGGDSFVYQIEDGNGDTDTATVSVTVTPINDPPSLLNNPLTVDEGSSDAIDATFL
ncbi:Ig-like domain-containing protein, partial [Geitlerinema sp. PCC 9228]|uniref:Ig-like domain-containing protein n=1 Tax=Geitlerinema sp. PCC 9228 TaxID=111611 RepID=UPI001481958E